MSDSSLPDAWLNFLRSETWLPHIEAGLRHVLEPSLLSPIFYVAVAAILLLEKWVPARREQKVLSVGLAQDFVWLYLHSGFKLLMFVFLLRGFATFYSNHLDFLTVPGFANAPAAVSLGAGILMTDLIGWVQHWVRHKVPWFWYFHAVHHSQREMNLFTDVRLHPVDWFVGTLIRTFFLLLFNVDAPEAVWYSLSLTWFTRAYHANLQLGFGLVGYALVSPNFHRVHHATAPTHQESNFGVLFTFWDRMFGTYLPTPPGSLETGIADEAFPIERSLRGFRLVTTPCYQLVYPFVQIASDLKRMYCQRFSRPT